MRGIRSFPLSGGRRRWAGGTFLLLLWAMLMLADVQATGPPAGMPEIKGAVMDQQLLEEVVNKALERQLAPIKEMLTEMTIRKPTLPDILGGFGYILGIFGLWAYFLSKKKKDN